MPEEVREVELELARQCLKDVSGMTDEMLRTGETFTVEEKTEVKCLLLMAVSLCPSSDLPLLEEVVDKLKPLLASEVAV